MSRSASYSYPPYNIDPSPSKQYPAAHSMSSAFSASANPNEDWTKISDLAERRRIQNRIAQRNYRKKLKKRLEDLERRAGSSSASPEAQPAELAKPESSSRAMPIPDNRTYSTQRQDLLGPQYLLPPEDRMFSQQYTRQISTSPPPFTYASMPVTDSFAYSNSYSSLPTMSMEQSHSSQYPPQPFNTGMNGMSSPPIKQEFYAEDEMNPFGMSYASISSLDVQSAQAYQDMAPYVSNAHRRNYG